MTDILTDKHEAYNHKINKGLCTVSIQFKPHPGDPIYISSQSVIKQSHKCQMTPWRGDKIQSNRVGGSMRFFSISSKDKQLNAVITLTNTNNYGHIIFVDTDKMKSSSLTSRIHSCD